MNVAAMGNVKELNDMVKVLGLQWKTATDMLSVVPRNITSSSPFLTKRDILQDSSKIFDPLSFITPITVQAKILLQELWSKHLQWDEPVDGELQAR